MIGDPVTEESNRRDAKPVNLYAAARHDAAPETPASADDRAFTFD